MGETTGHGEPAGGVRASDAERDATVERLSQAAGEGRLTLEEFSQRMEDATTARTRAELDRLLSDLPASPGHAGNAVALGSQAGPSWHVTPIGGLNVFGPWRMGRHVIVITLVGGARLDLSQAELAAPDVTLTKLSLVGGVRARIPYGIRVDASGVSLIGGTQVEGAPDPGPGAPTIHIRAYSLVGGIRNPAGRRRAAAPRGPARGPADAVRRAARPAGRSAGPAGRTAGRAARPAGPVRADVTDAAVRSSARHRRRRPDRSTRRADPHPRPGASPTAAPDPAGSAPSRRTSRG